MTLLLGGGGGLDGSDREAEGGRREVGGVNTLNEEKPRC